MRGKFVAYYRVSTDKQGKSGLGLEAQRKAVADYLDGGNWELMEEFTEVEMGKNNDRPELAKSIAFAKKSRLLHKAAAALNERGVKTAAGGEWRAEQVLWARRLGRGISCLQNGAVKYGLLLAYLCHTARLG